jgi:hypothetical protein
MLKDTPDLLIRVRKILTTNIEDVDNSKMGKIMSFENLEDSINIINQLYLGIQDKTT